MKKTNIISLTGLSLLVTSCVLDGEVTIFGWFFIIFFTVVLAMIIWEVVKRQEAEEKQKAFRERQKREQQSREAEMRIEREIKKDAYEADLIVIETELGVADKTIVFAEYDLNQEIRVYISSREVFILGRMYPFKKILSCSFTDNVNVKKGQTTIKSVGTTKADNANTIKRAVVGGLIGGVAGAAVGGATGKKNTTTTSVVSRGDDTTVHDYTVWISLRDIAKTMIEIHLGKDGRKVNEVVALMNAIIAGNDE